MSAAQYRISAPAIHATQTLLRNYQPQELGKFEATPRNIALMIDSATKIYQLQQQMQRLLTIAPYWVSQTHELAENIEEIREVIRLIEMTYEQMGVGHVTRRPHQTTDDGAWKEGAVRVLRDEQSDQAKRAARMLWTHYRWERTLIGKAAATERNLAILIDVSMDTWRANVTLPLLLRESGWMQRDFSDNFKALRRALSDLSLLHNHMPGIAPARPAGEPLAGYKPVQQQPTRDQIERMKPVAAAFEAARTVEEATRVMKNAGIITARS